MRPDVLPPEFAPISHLVNYVHRKSHNEYCGSCPQCGGTTHKNGEAPDRFVMFVVGRYGFPLAFCRKCGYRWTDKANLPSKDDVEQWRLYQIDVEKSRIQAARRNLELLQNDKVWEQFYALNNEYSLQMFRGWGIEQFWIDYLRLGIIPDYTVKSGEEYYHSPATTIPIWGVGGVVQNIKLRVTNPRHDRDRYRNFYPMGQSFLFIPRYDEPLKGAGILVEGEKKAIVLEQTLDDSKMRVVGLQTKTPAPELFSQLKDLDPVYIFLDPDAKEKENKGKESAVEYVTRLVGKDRARIVDCPVKLDDGIIQGLDPKKYLRMARKP